MTKTFFFCTVNIIIYDHIMDIKLLFLSVEKDKKLIRVLWKISQKILNRVDNVLT